MGHHRPFVEDFPLHLGKAVRLGRGGPAGGVSAQVGPPCVPAHNEFVRKHLALVAKESVGRYPLDESGGQTHTV